MARVKIIDILSAVWGTTDITGLDNVQIDLDEGNYIANVEDDKLYPTGADLTGNANGFPVTANIQFKDVTNDPLDDFGDGATAADLVVVGRADGTNDDITFTVVNFVPNKTTERMERQKDGANSISGIAFTDDGETVPYSAA